MKERIVKLIGIFLLWTLVFVLQKPVFMGYYRSLYEGVGVSDWLEVMGHGLPLDLSLAGYLTAIPALLLIASVWVRNKWIDKSLRIYFKLTTFVVSLIFVVDLVLYGYWGFRLDATPLFYFFTSPTDALASVGWGFKLMAVLLVLFLTLFIYMVFRRVLLSSVLADVEAKKRVSATVVLALLTAALFIPIRGGFSEATMNTGHVYYSDNMQLNYAAINPAFNLMESLSKEGDFAHQYRFMTDAEADAEFARLIDPQVTLDTQPDSLLAKMQRQSEDSLHNLFTTKTPDVLVVILESFSNKLLPSMGGEAVAVNLDALTRQSIFFPNFYANSFRTDRGLVSILSGYPAQPTMSLMKYPRKTQGLPSIARTLRLAGYGTSYYYGGDANFTNMRSYLRASGFEQIVSEDDFTSKERTGKWGVHDEVLFRRLLADLRTEAQGGGVRQPQYRVLQTSSSHEPFEVPYRQLDNPALNAFAYTDHCLGEFVEALKQLPQWKNTVLLIVPDHLGAYPEHIDNFTLERYQIPLVITGGAVREPKVIETIGSQQDIAATLLAQLDLPHSDFTFSKDLLDASAPHFAFFTVPDAMGMVTADNQWIFDNKSGRVVLDQGIALRKNERPAKAYLQKLYDDIANR